jgi:glycosyltransferase involved in cell wall biosynthesis
MSEPKVSVVIPTYNRAGTLRAALDSVCAQTFTDFEVIVADDGSTDETCNLMSAYNGKARYVRFEHRGKCAVLNSAMRLVRGEWVAVLDSDDEWLPRKLELQLEAVAAHPDCQFCFTDVLLRGYEPGSESAFHQSRKPFTAPCERIRDPVRYVLSPPHDIFVQASLIRRALLESVGGFNEALIAEDTDIIFRAALQTEFVVVNQPLVVVDRTPMTRPGSIMEQIKGSRKTDLQYRQKMYEGWLMLEEKLNASTLIRVRHRLAEVHEAWCSWHLGNCHLPEALSSLQEANRIRFRLRRWAKSLGLRLSPGLVAKIIMRRRTGLQIRTQA